MKLKNPNFLWARSSGFIAESKTEELKRFTEVQSVAVSRAQGIYYRRIEVTIIKTGEWISLKGVGGPSLSWRRT